MDIIVEDEEFNDVEGSKPCFEMFRPGGESFYICTYEAFASSSKYFEAGFEPLTLLNS